MKLIAKTTAFMMFALALVVATSCNKYEEGPKFTLLTAKARLVNTWTLTKAESNGNDVTSFFPGIKVEINKDNTYKMTYTAGSISTTEEGKWEFNDDKTTVTFIPDGETTGEPQTIVMLKNKMLKLKSVDGSTTTVITFEGA